MSLNSTSDLDKLIFKLSSQHKRNDPSISSIKHFDLLLIALHELNSLIGMKRLKDSITLQILKLIKNLNSKNPTTNMLHTVLYGPPGVGKTRVGLILAKIWYALGYLKTPKSKPKESDPNKDIINTLDKIQSNNSMTEYIPLLIPLGIILISSGGLMGLLIMLGLIIIAWLYYKITTYFNPTTETVVKKSVMSSEKVDKTDFKPDRELITVVSRKDFMGQYMGQTAEKTQKLLENNRGKVLLIDEAYSLVNHPMDAYGHEALSTLILFMSEHPDEIGIIFAGYRDKLESTIFEAQPGLVRRCMWHFDCDPYTGKELAEIFLHQLKQQKYFMPEQDMRKSRLLIEQNAESFPSFGGDTERLLYFAQLEACRNNLTEDITDSEEILTYEDILAGFKRLCQNNIKTNKSHKCNGGTITESEIEQLMNKFTRQEPSMDMDNSLNKDSNDQDEIQNKIKEIMRKQIIMQH